MYNLIKEFEGFKSEPYKCSAGVWTLGYGSTTYMNGEPVCEGDPDISEQFAENLLNNYMLKFVRPVMKDNICIPLNINEKEAIESLIYNIGITAFNKSTLLKKLNEDTLYSAAEEFLKWIYVNRKINKGLIKRRTKELIHFLTPAYKGIDPIDKTIVKRNIFVIIINAIIGIFKKGE